MFRKGEVSWEKSPFFFLLIIMIWGEGGILIRGTVLYHVTCGNLFMILGGRKNTGFFLALVLEGFLLFQRKRRKMEGVEGGLVRRLNFQKSKRFGKNGRDAGSKRIERMMEITKATSECDYYGAVN